MYVLGALSCGAQRRAERDTVGRFLARWLAKNLGEIRGDQRLVLNHQHATPLQARTIHHECSLALLEPHLTPSLVLHRVDSIYSDRILCKCVTSMTRSSLARVHVQERMYGTRGFFSTSAADAGP